MKASRVDALLQRIRNHKFLAVVIVVGIVVIAFGAFFRATEDIARIVTPAPHTSVADVLVGRNKQSLQYQITIQNPSQRPALITRVNISEGTWDSVPSGDGTVVCSGPRPYQVRDRIVLRSTGHFSGTVGTRTADSLEFEVPTSGSIGYGCGYRGLVLEFDAQIAIDAAQQVSFVVVVPRLLKVVRDSSAFVNSPLGYVPPAAIRIDSLLRVRSHGKLAVKLTTSDGRLLTYTVSR